MIFKRRIGNKLVRAGLISKEQLKKALEIQQRNHYRLGYNLIKLGYIDEEAFTSFLSEHLDAPAIMPGSMKIDDKVFKLLPPEIIRSNCLIPISKVHNTLTVAMSDPFDDELIQYLEQITGLSVKAVVSPQSAIKRIIDKKFFKESLPTFLKDQADTEHISDLFSELPDYRIVDVLGEGGFGKIFKCLQLSLDRYVAVKTLSKALARNREIVERFRREAKIVAQLNHPNIIKIIEQGEVENYFYFVMEYIEGICLNEYLEDRDIVTKLSILNQVCDALSHAHSLGIVHRDIKPQNILVTKDINVKLLDFGISLIRTSPDQRLTDPFLVLGTPKYMSPEQSTNPLDVDHLSDIYSLGVLMFELFAEVEFIPENLKPPITFNPMLPEELNAAILKSLKQERKKRFQSCDELRFALSSIKDKIVLSPSAVAGSHLEENGPLGENVDIKNKYDFITLLKNEGGVETLLAEHKGLDRLVVIKRFDSEQGSNEARLLSRVKHAHIADVLGMAEADEKYIVVTEYLKGGSIEDKIVQKPAIEEMISILKSLVSALSFAFNNRISHGNLHPNNILIDRNDVIKLTDFNVASTAPESLERYRLPRAPSTPLQRDLFSIGVLLYEMISGKTYDPVGGPEWNYYQIKDFRIAPEKIKTVLQKLWSISRRPDKYTSFASLLADVESLDRPVLSPSASARVTHHSSDAFIQIEKRRSAARKRKIGVLVCGILFIVLSVLLYVTLRMISSF